MYNPYHLLKGSIDFHVHAAPDTIKRPFNELEVAEKARKAGMRALVLKNANTSTSYRSYLIKTIIPEIEAFGGVCLNYPIGGLNTRAIDSAVKSSYSKHFTKIVWMPTIDAENDEIYRQSDEKGISILRDGEISIEAKEVLKKIYEHDLVLGTGHLSLNEIKILVREARKIGIKKILINHVDSPLFKMDIEDQKELSEMGAYLEHTIAVCLPSYLPRPISAAKIAKAMKDVGPSSCIMATDLVDLYQPDPVEGMRMFIHLMMKNGVSREDIGKMVKTNPEKLLDLRP